MKKCDAVFCGGGVRGIAHVGAVCAIEDSGYEFENLAGSSCGAIVAGLIAVGYRGSEIKEIMKTLDYTKFQQERGLSRLGTLGKITNTITRLGVYSSQYFESWFNALLIKKGKTKFGDIKIDNPQQEKYKYKLQVTASDVTSKRLLTLPRDALLFGIEPDELSIARAVQMSMSIPFFYMPYTIKGLQGKTHYIVDGGLLSNYPIWMLDDGSKDPVFPTFGFKFVDDGEGNERGGEQDLNLISYSRLILSTLMSATDKCHISVSKGDYQRSILIPVGIDIDGENILMKSTDFDITERESELLFENGYRAGQDFISKWDFESWKRQYRA